MNNQGGWQGGRPRQGPGGAFGVLQVVGGNDRGKQYTLTGPTTQIGRGADQDFVLADIAVSRRHVQVLIEGSRYRLRDLGSGNGTLINGVRTATALLNDGDQIEIGNTLMRFDHPPSSARAGTPGMGAPAYSQVPQAPAQARTMIADAPMYPGQAQPQPAVAPYEAPPPPGYVQHAAPDALSLPVQRGPQPAPSIVPSSYPRPGASGGTGRKVALFGGIGLLVLVGAGLVLRQLKTSGAVEEAQKAYKDATTAFSSGDFEGAKRLFQSALQLDPQNKLIPQQLKQCDIEVHAKGALKTAQGLAAAQQWDQELKVLDSIDKTSTAFTEGEKLRKAAIPQAIAALLADARESLKSDPDAAKQKIEAALELDPDSADARALAEQLGGPVAVPAAGGSHGGSGGSRTSHRTSSAGSASSSGGSNGARGGDPGFKPVGLPDKPATGPVAATPATRPAAATPPPPSAVEDEAGADSVLTSKGAAAPYKARDFAGAAAALRAEAKSQKGAAATRLGNLAAQVARLGDSYNKAEADKGRNPAGAAVEYMDAAGLDAAVGKGTHGAYLKGQAAKLAKDGARQAFNQQRYDQAFELSKIAIRAGGDDGGVGNQLRGKAAEFNTKAQAMAKSNPSGAKTMWRSVQRMVPPTDPAYLTATKALASTGGAKDEDEE